MFAQARHAIRTSQGRERPCRGPEQAGDPGAACDVGSAWPLTHLSACCPLCWAGADGTTHPPSGIWQSLCSRCHRQNPDRPSSPRKWMPDHWSRELSPRPPLPRSCSRLNPPGPPSISKPTLRLCFPAICCRTIITRSRSMKEVDDALSRAYARAARDRAACGGSSLAPLVWPKPGTRGTLVWLQPRAACCPNRLDSRTHCYLASPWRAEQRATAG